MAAGDEQCPAGSAVPGGGLDDDLLSAEQAAEFLGLDMGTFQMLNRCGSLPRRLVGENWAFSRQSLERWRQEHA